MGLLEEGPIRKWLKDRQPILPQVGEISPQLYEIMSSTGLRKYDAERFLEKIGIEPYLYVFYDEYGNVVDWDYKKTEEYIRRLVEDRWEPKFHSYKIFNATIKMDLIAEGVQKK